MRVTLQHELVKGGTSGKSRKRKTRENKPKDIVTYSLQYKGAEVKLRTYINSTEVPIVEITVRTIQQYRVTLNNIMWERPRWPAGCLQQHKKHTDKVNARNFFRFLFTAIQAH